MVTLKRTVVNGLMSGWRPVKSSIPEGSVLGLMLFNMFFSNMDHGTECILKKFDGDTKLCGAVDKLEGRNTIHRDFDRLDRWTNASLMEFNQSK